MHSFNYLLILSFLFSTSLPIAFSDDFAGFSDCNNTFSCGPISNVSYPFSGGDRPDHCGLPDFKLTCRQPENITLLTHNSITYRILHLDQSLKKLTISRQDLSKNTCPSQFFNSSFDSNLFSIPDLDDNLTLFYGCNDTAMSLRPHNLFNCNNPSLNFSGAYYMVGPIPRDPNLKLIYCSISVSMPITKSVRDRLTTESISLREALMEGISVNYIDPYEKMCSACAQFGGYCGFDSTMRQPDCICEDRLCALPPPDQGDTENSSSTFQGGKGRSSTSINIILPIVGAVLAGIGLGWVIFCCRQRRKRLAVQSHHFSSTDKELPTTLANKDYLAPPSIAFTKSIPSYPSTKFDSRTETSYFGARIFTYTELEEATEDFAQARELGDGGFGAVYYGVLSDGCVVAVKRLYENNYKRVEQFKNEVEILTRLRHPNLVMLYGCSSKRSRDLLLVYEYVPNGTVADHLHGNRAKSGLLSWPVRLNIAIETAEALAYLHASDIIHRDVKTNNILLDNDFHVKVADFGLSRLFPVDATHVSTAPQGTPGYVDPEYYQWYQLTEKSDVYSFGVVLVELISSLQAVDINRSRHDINLANMAINKVQNHAVHELVDQTLQIDSNSSVKKMVTLVAELAFRCLQQEKDMRPSMQEVLDTLRRIQSGGLNAQKVEVVDILVDDCGSCKDATLPPSPDSVTDKSTSTSAKSSRG